KKSWPQLRGERNGQAIAEVGHRLRTGEEEPHLRLPGRSILALSALVLLVLVRELGHDRNANAVRRGGRCERYERLWRCRRRGEPWGTTGGEQSLEAGF